MLYAVITTFKVGDAVFKVSSEQAFTLSEAACRRRLDQAGPQPEPIALDVTLAQDSLVLRAEVRGSHLESHFAVESFPAQDSPLSRQTLETVFAKSAGDRITSYNVCYTKLLRPRYHLLHDYQI